MVKKVKLLLAALFLLIPFLVQPVLAAEAEPVDNPCSDPSQDGSARHPYLICAPDQLQRLHDHPSAHFALRADLDLAGTDWTPVPAFSGTLDGGGHTMANLTTGIGLFDIIEQGGTVKRLYLVDTTVNGFFGGGMLAGVNRGTITRVEASGTVSGRWTLGGLVGTNEGTIRNSRVQGTVNGDTGVGGIAGVNAAGALIRDSQADVTIHGSYYTGGIAGTNNGIIRRTDADGVIHASAGASGGLAGYNDGTIAFSASRNDIHYHAPFAETVHLISGLEYGTVTATTGYGHLHESP